MSIGYSVVAHLVSAQTCLVSMKLHVFNIIHVMSTSKNSLLCSTIYFKRGQIFLKLRKSFKFMDQSLKSYF